MTILESPALDLARLERIAQTLWSVEPDCPLDDRFALMMRLSRVSSSLEQLRFRTDFPSDTGPDPFDVDVCRIELLELSAQWSSGLDHDVFGCDASSDAAPPA